MIDLRHGDCLEIMPTIPDKSIDLTVTSPPYDNLRTYNGSLVWGEHIWKPVIEQLYRVTKDGGVVVWVVNDATIKGSETLTSFKQALYFREVGFNMHDTMIYKSHKPPLTHNRYEPEFEYMFIASVGKPKTFNPIKVKTNFGGDVKKFNYGNSSEAKKEKGDAVRWRDETYIVNETKIKGNIWEYATGLNGSTKDRFAFEHPAIYPEQLAHDHIISWSNEGDTVFDCFLGSGTTGKMAKQLNRNFIGIEKDAKYFEIAQKRIYGTMPQEKLAI